MTAGSDYSNYVVIEVRGKRVRILDVPRACPVCGSLALKPAYVNRYGEVTWACRECDTWSKDWAARAAGKKEVIWVRR
ncbi:MAG: hypothetical protein QXX12_01020 [Nanopusillaceae archaeon]